MKIQKIFTDTEGYERLYSVLLSEEELALFSEIQREFAFKDYEGLSEAQAKVLKAKRSDYAKELLENHRKTQKDITGVASRLGEDLGSISTTGEVVGGGVRTNFETKTVRGSNKSAASAIRHHRGEVIKNQLKGSGDAKKLMREVVEREISSGGPKWKRPVSTLTKNIRKNPGFLSKTIKRL